MKILSCITALLLSLTSFGYEYHCSNKDVTIKVDGNTIIEEVEEYKVDPKKIFDNDYRYTILEKGVEAKTFSIVAASSDGAGQEAFEVFKLGTDLSPLENVASFYFEHEGGCLEGNYFSFKTNKWVDIPGCWSDSPNRLMCDPDY